MKLLKTDLFEDAANVDEVAYATETLSGILHARKWQHFDAREAYGSLYAYGWLSTGIGAFILYQQGAVPLAALILAGLIAVMVGMVLRFQQAREIRSVEAELEFLERAAERAYNRIHDKMVAANRFQTA